MKKKESTEKKELVDTIYGYFDNIRVAFYNFEQAQQQNHEDDKKNYIEKHSLSESETASLIMDRERFVHVHYQSLKVILKSTFADIFELTMDYCSKTKQKDILKNDPLYEFWSVMRNCLNHNYRFSFYSSTLKKLPVSWRNLTIDKELDGKDLTLKFFPMSKVFEFFSDIETLLKKLS